MCHTFSQLISQPDSQFVSQSFGRSVSQAVSLFVMQSANQSVSVSFSQSASQRVSRFNQSVNCLIVRPLFHSFIQLFTVIHSMVSLNLA